MALITVNIGEERILNYFDSSFIVHGCRSASASTATARAHRAPPWGRHGARESPLLNGWTSLLRHFLKKVAIQSGRSTCSLNREVHDR